MIYVQIGVPELASRPHPLYTLKAICRRSGTPKSERRYCNLTASKSDMLRLESFSCIIGFGSLMISHLLKTNLDSFSGCCWAHAPLAAGPSLAPDAMPDVGF